MNTAKRLLTKFHLHVRIAAVVAAVVVGAAACGSGAGAGSGEEVGFQKVTPSDVTFTLDDLAATGFKKQKEYDVEGLTGATGAWFGWWRTGGADPVDYEVRFYPSHEDAVEHGTSFAEEASGKDAIINSNDATWKEDVRDRRTIISSDTSDGGGAGPKYADYAVFANMVLLCQGSTSDQSLERCETLVDALESGAAE